MHFWNPPQKGSVGRRGGWCQSTQHSPPCYKTLPLFHLLYAISPVPPRFPSMGLWGWRGQRERGHQQQGAMEERLRVLHPQLRCRLASAHWLLLELF